MNTAEIIFREMTEKDFDFISSARENDFSDGWNKNMLVSSYRAERFFGFIAEAEGVSVGFITFSLSVDDADIESVYVIPTFRRNKIASALLIKAETEIAGKGKDKIFLEVKTTNDAAQKLYSSHGYSLVSVRKKYYADGKDAAVMVKNFTPDKK